MHKTFEYRLHPNRIQHGQLLSCLTQSRRIYNEMLEVVKDHHDETGGFFNRYDLTYRFKGRGGEHVPQSTVQTLANRLDKALKRFLHRRELGQKVGFPRFKFRKDSLSSTCGYIEDRDVNAAKNILLRAGARPSGANVDGCIERSPRSRLH
jgi:transposase